MTTATDKTPGPKFRILWKVIEVHEVTLTAERLAEILNITVEELLDTPTGDIEYLGNTGLADALAEADDDDEHEVLEFNREEIEVQDLSDAGVQP